MTATPADSGAAERARAVQRGDPDRFRTAMLARPDRRADLFTLYAFNLEIARAPFAASEPALAAMRLQFWQDILKGAPPDHPLAPPLLELIDRHALPRQPFARMIAARARLRDPQPFDRHALFAHLDATAGTLAWLAALTLAAPATAEAPIRHAARAGGLANLLQAHGALTALNPALLSRLPPEELSALAAETLAGLAPLRRQTLPRRLMPVLAQTTLAAPVLARAARDADRIIEGRLAPFPPRQSLTLIRAALTGRW